MEQYLVSARKYRPTNFSLVVGQEHVTDTLKNAIIQQKIAHAFLFCGPRGVGKTTCARILAKTINCTQLSESGEACDHCESCISFNQNRSFNIHELDAASHNSVDDIRSLVDQVRFIPQSGKYKIYIIDEVHMLSQSAFNAFLKTLEEPPSYAIFILATTEKHKIIPTILSRCQIFDFNRIQVKDITLKLEEISQKENVKADKEALHLIAQKSDGALRDALSIFDQIVSFTSGDVSYKAVIENLHILDYDYYFKITDFMLKHNLPEMLLIFDEILQNGFDGHNFICGLSEHLRNLLVCKDKSTLRLLPVSENAIIKYGEQSQIVSTNFIINALQIINQCDIHYKNSKNQRLHAEICLMKLSALLTEVNKIVETYKKPENIKPELPVTEIKSKPSPVQEIERKTIPPTHTQAAPVTPSINQTMTSLSSKIKNLEDVKNLVKTNEQEKKKTINNVTSVNENVSGYSPQTMENEVVTEKTNNNLPTETHKTTSEKFTFLQQKYPFLTEIKNGLKLELVY